MKIFLATDHAGFAMKNELLDYLRDELQYEVEDCGAASYDETDDYPDYVKIAARAVAENPVEHRAIVLGGSGQGEAITANRFKNVRAAVYYGEPAKEQVDVDGQSLDIVVSSRLHNDANVLSLGARFIDTETAKAVVKTWLNTTFSEDERHQRRLVKIDTE